MLDSVSVISKCECRVPSEVFGVYIDTVERQFEAVVVHLSEVGGDGTETAEARKALGHDHVVGLLPVEIQGAGDAIVEESEVESDVGRRCLLPLQARIGQAVGPQILHVENRSRLCDVAHRGPRARTEVGQRDVRVFQRAVTVLTP